MSKQFPEQQLDFLKLCKQPHFHISYPLASPLFYNSNREYKRAVAMWLSLINEEVNTELRSQIMDYILNPLSVSEECSMLSPKQLAEIADSIADSIYVLCGLANAMGLPLTRVWNEVHRANLDKAPDGILKKRQDGKILKPVGWKAPDILGIIKEAIHEHPHED